MKNWIITRAKAQDAALLARMGASNFLKAYAGMMDQTDLEAYAQEAFTEENMQKELSDPQSACFLAGQGNLYAGYCQVSLGASPPCVPPGRNAKLQRIYLNPDFYGQGVGQILFHAAKSWALEQGQEGLWLSVWDEHSKGQKFHAKMGFVPIGEENFQVGRECQRDIVMFQKI